MKIKGTLLQNDTVSIAIKSLSEQTDYQNI